MTDVPGLVVSGAGHVIRITPNYRQTTTPEVDMAARKNDDDDTSTLKSPYGTTVHVSKDDEQTMLDQGFTKS